MRGQGTQPGKRRAVLAVATIAGAAVGVAVVAGCASRGSGLANRPDKSAGGAIAFAAEQVFAAKSVHVHATISGEVGGTIDGSLLFAPTLQADLSVKVDKNQDMVPDRVLYDGKTFYAALPKGFHATAKTKPNAAWFAEETAGLSPKESSILTALKTDPAALVKDALTKGKFTEDGADPADGQSATHFYGDLTGAAPGHLDVWLNSVGLPIEIVFQSSRDAQPPAHAELHFSQWGRPVTITAPPKDQVLTQDDQISFAISGQEFKVSSDQLGGSPVQPSGTPVVIGGTPSPGGPVQTVCIPTSNLPTPIRPSAPNTCLEVTLTIGSPHFGSSSSGH